MENVLLERSERVTTLIINRPKALNALDFDTLTALNNCFKELAGDTSVDVVIITGAGEKAFVAGADIAYMQNLGAIDARRLGILGQQVMDTIENFRIPVIAAVNGFALGGGCELALACDIRVASHNAKFGQPEVNLGVIPGFGGTQRLPRLIGKGRGCEMLFTGDIIDAEEAYRIGLVNRIVEQERLLEVCHAMAKKISSKGPLAVALCKEAVNNGMQMDVRRACQYEVDLFGLCFASDEQKEGMNAFLEKRPARFT